MDNLPRKYHHLFKRVEYPLENGYRMESYPLPDWIHVSISTKVGSKILTVHSRIHVNKEVVIHPAYSNEFTDMEILKDLSGEISRRFL